MTWKQFLTERVLKEQWHELFLNMPKVKCSCGKEFFALSLDALNEHRTRTFTTEADMMALYRQIEKNGKWVSYGFERWIYQRYYAPDALAGYMSGTTFTKWLFCLDGKDYEDRCKKAAEFYGWREE